MRLPLRAGVPQLRLRVSVMLLNSVDDVAQSMSVISFETLDDMLASIRSSHRVEAVVDLNDSAWDVKDSDDAVSEETSKRFDKSSVDERFVMAAGGINSLPAPPWCGGTCRRSGRFDSIQLW
jgi:hypothetical protein